MILRISVVNDDGTERISRDIAFEPGDESVPMALFGPMVAEADDFRERLARRRSVGP